MAYTAFIRGGNGIQVVNAILGRDGGGGGGGRGGRGGGAGRGGPPGRGGGFGGGGGPASNQPLAAREVAQLRSKLKGAKYTVTHLTDRSKIHTIDAFSLQPANEIQFTMTRRNRDRPDDPPNEEQTNVADYFRRVRRLKFWFHDAVCAWNLFK